VFLIGAQDDLAGETVSARVDARVFFAFVRARAGGFSVVRRDKTSMIAMCSPLIMKTSGSV
jgi:hypothetical protein